MILNKGLFTWRWGTPGGWCNTLNCGKPPVLLNSRFFGSRLHDRYGDLPRRVARYTEVKVCEVNVSRLVSPTPPGGMGVTTIFEPQLSRLDWDILFFYPLPPPPPPNPPMEGYVVFMVGTIEDGILVVQNVVSILIKDRGRLLLLMGGKGGRGEVGRGRGEGGGEGEGGGGEGEGEKKNGMSNFIFSLPPFISLRRF